MKKNLKATCVASAVHYYNIKTARNLREKLQNKKTVYINQPLSVR